MTDSSDEEEPTASEDEDPCCIYCMSLGVIPAPGSGGRNAKVVVNGATRNA